MLLGNYFKTAWRNLLRYKLFSTINILGLAIGLAAVMLITLFVRHELSYDNFWAKSDDIYRMQIRTDVPGKDPAYDNGMPPPLAAALKKDFSEIDLIARILDIKEYIVIDNTEFELSFALVDPDIIRIFDFNVLHGDITNALNDKSSLILSESQAIKHFGKSDIVGQTATIKFFDHVKDYRITAIIADPPQNTVIPLNGMLLLAPEDFGENIFTSWFRNFAQTYFTLKPDADLTSITNRFPEFIDRNFAKLPFGGPEMKQSDAVHLSTLKMQDLHLKAPGRFEIAPKGNMNTVIIFAAVALLILIIASINFMNLSTARASQRAKEVSLRKVMGASRQNLIFQFLGESVLLTIIALLIALLIVELSLPYYNDVIGKELIIDYLSLDLLQIILFALFIGVMGGLYPALVLSSFRPAAVLKANKSSETKASVKLRAVLVIFQFSISITLFVSTAVIFSQMKYAENMDLGYTRENLVTINGNNYEKLVEKINIIVERFKTINNVSNVTYSTNFAAGTAFTPMDPVRTEQSQEFDPIMMTFRGVGYDFLKTYDIPLIVGRDYARNRNDERPTREQLEAGEGYTASIILNKSAVRQLGFGTPEQAIGKLLYMNVGLVDDDGGQKMLEAEFSVVGVIDDIHFVSLKSPVQSEFYQLKASQPYFVALRYSGNPMDVVESARTIWQEEMPGVTFEYKFASDALAEQYKEEQGQMFMFAAFSGLAIFIACLGLFGLASFTAERRTKEIGIRKVMGASIFDIVKLLVWQFSKPVIIANLIAWPLSFYAMSRWLESFVYRIDNIIIIAMCLVAGLTALLIAWATVAGNSYTVARQNPIKALRYE